jgi:hypothetical protein
MLATAGVSIFGQPAREVLYSAPPPTVVCHARGCTAIYRLEVGNSGAEAQDEVTVRVRAAVVDRALLPVHVRDFGKIDRPFRVRDEGEVRAYLLGRVDPRVRVELSFLLAVPRADLAVGWDHVLAGVEAPGARVAPGDAAWVLVLRAWYAFLALF